MSDKIETIDCIGIFRGRTVVFTLPIELVKNHYVYHNMSEINKFFSSLKVVDVKTKGVLKDVISNRS